MILTSCSQTGISAVSTAALAWLAAPCGWRRTPPDCRWPPHPLPASTGAFIMTAVFGVGMSARWARGPKSLFSASGDLFRAQDAHGSIRGVDVSQNPDLELQGTDLEPISDQIPMSECRVSTSKTAARQWRDTNQAAIERSQRRFRRFGPPGASGWPQRDLRRDHARAPGMDSGAFSRPETVQEIHFRQPYHLVSVPPSRVPLASTRRTAEPM